MTPELPSISAIVRSYNRLDACLELLDVLQAQDHPDFEIIVIEQSDAATPAQRAALEARAEADARLRIFKHPPLGPAGARNAGWRAARKEIIVFCDDDDLPIGAGWLRAHAALYADPDVIGVSGREVMRPDETCGYGDRRAAERGCLAYGFFGYPTVYCRLDVRVDPVDWLHGGNASVRLSAVRAVDGWFEAMWDHEEHSFAFKLRRHLKGRQRLIFDPGPVVLRRKDIPGGLARGEQRPVEIHHRWFRYYHRLFGPFHLPRFLLFYPIFAALPLGLTLFWLWKGPQRARYHRLTRLGLSLGLPIIAPALYLRGWRDLMREKT